MNIWFFSAHDQPRGLSSRNYEYARELVNRGHQVTMFTNSYCHWNHTERLTSGEKWRIEMIDGIRIIWLKTIPYKKNGWRRGVNMLSNVWRSIQVARSLLDKPDIIIGPSVPPGTGWAAAYVATKKKAAFVFEVRDVWPIRLVYDGSLSKKSPVYILFRLIEKSLYRKAQRISSAVPFIHQHVAKSGSDPNKIRWIPNGVNCEKINQIDSEKSDDTHESLPLVAMYVGGVGDKHGVLTIINAAYQLQQKGNKDYRFVIVGNGSKKAEYQQIATQKGVRNIEFRAAVPKSEVFRVQMEADVLIASVLNSEAYQFGINFNKLFDYFLSGKPVILACNAPNDPVIDSGAGISIPPENPDAMVVALERLQKMTVSERVEMGERGREHVESEYDIRKLAVRMESLFIEAIKIKGVTNAA